MQIHCPECSNHRDFLISLWVRTTFKFNTDGSISILHVRPLEVLEEKLADQFTSGAITCQACGAAAVVEFNAAEFADRVRAESAAVEAL